MLWSQLSPCPDTQAKELLDHLEDVLSNQPIQVSGGNTIVEVKPQGVSKGGVIERILAGGQATTTAGSAGEGGRPTAVHV